jgi:hypothetical protein
MGTLPDGHGVLRGVVRLEVVVLAVQLTNTRLRIADQRGWTVLVVLARAHTPVGKARLPVTTIGVLLAVARVDLEVTTSTRAPVVSVAAYDARRLQLELVTILTFLTLVGVITGGGDTLAGLRVTLQIRRAIVWIDPAPVLAQAGLVLHRGAVEPIVALVVLGARRGHAPLPKPLVHPQDPAGLTDIALAVIPAPSQAHLVTVLAIGAIIVRATPKNTAPSVVIAILPRRALVRLTLLAQTEIVGTRQPIPAITVLLAAGLAEPGVGIAVLTNAAVVRTLAGRRHALICIRIACQA